LKDKLKVKVLI